MFTDDESDADHLESSQASNRIDNNCSNDNDAFTTAATINGCASSNETTMYNGLKEMSSNLFTVNIELFKRLFDDSLKDLKTLKVINDTNTYTGAEVDAILNFFKIPLANRIKENQHRLIIRKNIESKLSTEIDEIDIDAEMVDSNNSNSVDYKRRSFPINRSDIQMNEHSNSNQKDADDEMKKLLQSKIIIPDLMDNSIVDDHKNGINNGENNDDDDDEFQECNSLEKSPVIETKEIDDDNHSNHSNEIENAADKDDMTETLDDLESFNGKPNTGHDDDDANDENIDDIFQSDIPDTAILSKEQEISADNSGNVGKILKELNSIEEFSEEDTFRDATILIDETVEHESSLTEISPIKASNDRKFDKILINETGDEVLENSKKETVPLNSTSIVAAVSESSCDDEDDDDDGCNIVMKRKKKLLASLDSDEEKDDGDDENSNDSKIKLKTYSKLEKDDTSDDDEKTKKKSKKRKRIVLDLSSDDDDDDVENDKKSKNNSSNDSDEEQSSRKKIRNILSKDRLREETRNAEKAELERRKRIEEKQKLYNSISEKEPENCALDRVILDVDKQTKEVLVEVDPAFVQVLKPHQVDGIRFMFNCTVETVERLKNSNHQSGCILAHSMGLGKTLQVVVFLHTIMNNKHTKERIRQALILVPLNVAKNWASEFNKWLLECRIENEILVYEMINAKSLPERTKMLNRWKETGGILIITINLFSQLVKGNKLPKNQRKSAETIIRECLLDPGPDIVIVDEGHLLKNDKSAFNNTINQICTLRRVILTGTPLQNNLSEYFIMVDFVKPSLLGTKREFKNRFENPIVNGQHIDSTQIDVKLMKKRVHILHKLLESCIHRCSYSVLVPYLQPKFEFVLSIRLTDIQAKLYRHYLDVIADKTGRSLLPDCAMLRLIWNHPALLIHHYRRKMENEDSDEANSLDDFIVETDDDSDDDKLITTKMKKAKNEPISEDSDSEIECIFDGQLKSTDTKRLTRSQGQAPELMLGSRNGGGNEWWESFITEETAQKIDVSSKFIILFSILEQCEVLGDKLLIFSQSLDNLDLIERMLELKMHETNEKYGTDISYEELVQKTGGMSHRWYPNIDYFRIDGQVKCDARHSMIDVFNDEDNHRARLMLVSTKAGGLGINLTGANRCVIFDVSWNPSHDLQAIYRIFRYGQKKPVYIYRFISYGTMENKIYDRQITKQSMARRVIDELQITRHFKQSELAELYTYTEFNEEDHTLPDLPKDRLLADLFLKHKKYIVSYHEHDSLLENRPEEELTEEERKNAWDEYERFKNPIETEMLPWQQNSLLQQQQNLNQQQADQQSLPYMFNQLQQLATTSGIQQQKPLWSSAAGFLTSLAQNSLSTIDRTNNMAYKNYYEKLLEAGRRQQEQLRQQSSHSKSFIPSDVANNFAQTTEQLQLSRYFLEIYGYFRRTPLLPQQYRSVTLDSICDEFTRIFKIRSDTVEWLLKLLCYLSCLCLFFNQNRKPETESILAQLTIIRREFISKFNLRNHSILLNQIISRMNNQTNQSSLLDSNYVWQRRPATVSSDKPIECIQLDSDDEDNNKDNNES